MSYVTILCTEGNKNAIMYQTVWIWKKAPKAKLSNKESYILDSSLKNSIQINQLQTRHSRQSSEVSLTTKDVQS